MKRKIKLATRPVGFKSIGSDINIGSGDSAGKGNTSKGRIGNVKVPVFHIGTSCRQIIQNAHSQCHAARATAIVENSLSENITRIDGSRRRRTRKSARVREVDLEQSCMRGVG